jgi:hypothetical protein
MNAKTPSKEGRERKDQQFLFCSNFSFVSVLGVLAPGVESFLSSWRTLGIF